jgi:hypothetical protein
MDKSDCAIKKVSNGQVIWSPGSRNAWLSNSDFSKRVYFQSENFFLQVEGKKQIMIDSLGLKTPKFESDTIEMFWMGQTFFFIEKEESNMYAVFRVSDGSRFCELDTSDIRFVRKEDK